MDVIHTPAFATHVNELLQQWHVPGLAVAIVQNSTIASKGFGMASFNPPSYMTADTLFDIASSSKSLTAASIGLFAVDDINYPELQWDTPMSHLLPDDFVMSGEGYTEKVTVEDILSHRSGFPRHDFSYFGVRSKHPDTPQSVTRNLRNLPNAAPWRTRFMYSNIMYIVASWLVETVSSSSFADYLHEHFFAPLGMNSTHLQPDSAIDAGLRDRMATPYVWEAHNESFRAIPFIQAPEAQGCGSIFTSANDYVRWVRAMMNQEPPVSKQLYEELLRPRICEDPEGEDNPQPSCYAVGWQVIEYRGIKLVGHGGSVSGYGSIHFFLPELNFGGVVLGNCGGSDEAWGTYLTAIVAAELIDKVLKTTPAERRDSHIREKKGLFPTTKRKDDDIREELCPNRTAEEPQRIPLEAYTGEYCNIGYRCLTVAIKANSLFVNAIDRSEGFTLTFEHVCNQTKYVAHMEDYWEGGDEETTAEFKFDAGQAVEMGVWLDYEVRDYIWFERIPLDYGVEQIALG